MHREPIAHALYFARNLQEIHCKMQGIPQGSLGMQFSAHARCIFFYYAKRLRCAWICLGALHSALNTITTGDADTLAVVSPSRNNLLHSPGGTLAAMSASAQNESAATPLVSTAGAHTLLEGADTPLATRVDEHAELAGNVLPVTSTPSPSASRGDVPP